MLAPKRVKYRKRFKGRTNGLATRGNTVAFGHYGLMSLEAGWVTNRPIEAARVQDGRAGAETGSADGGEVPARVPPRDGVAHEAAAAADASPRHRANPD